jgi:hypothetical protein
VSYDKDEIFGSTARRRSLAHPPAERARAGSPTPDGIGAFGPEAHERAADMAYHRIVKIQQESPYIQQEGVERVVEHVVHDQRLYLGMWIVAGVGAVSTFLTFSLPCLLVTAVAVGFALYCSPGRS